MIKPLMSICIPTYKRKEVLIPDVKRYLSVLDDRFIVKVNDNHSEDGTVDELMAIGDSRLIVKENAVNFGSVPNWMLALSDSEAEYLLFVLDKDTIDETLLPDFLDMLNRERPYFGFIDLSNGAERRLSAYKKGIDAVRNVAFLSKHPSGYFWRTDLFESEIEKDYFKKIDPKFDFPFEMIAGSLATMYDAMIVHWPLIINENLRKNENPSINYAKTYTYNEDNIFYGAKRRLVEFGYYIDLLYNLQLPGAARRSVAKKLTRTACANVSVTMRSLYMNDAACSHYNIRKRKVFFPEMLTNIFSALQVYRTTVKTRTDWRERLSVYLFALYKGVGSTCKIVIKEFFIRPEQKGLSA